MRPSRPRTTVARAAAVLALTAAGASTWAAAPAHAAGVVTARVDAFGNLSVSGDSLDNSVSITAATNGTLLVNAGAVVIQGGPATTTTTKQISVTTGSGDDFVSIDEKVGAGIRSTMILGPGDDVAQGGSGADSIFGQTGIDALNGRGGADFVDGGSDRDFVGGGAGTDVQSGGDGDDELRHDAVDGDDQLIGGTGTDLAIVAGSASSDIFLISKGTGPTSLRVDLQSSGSVVADTETVSVSGGFGNDTMLSDNSVADAGRPALELLGGSGRDTMVGAAGDERMNGGDDTDALFGGGGNDQLNGGSGADFLDGGPGTDRVLGDADDDQIAWNAGGGDDDIDGGAGHDVLMLDSGAAPDTVGVVAAPGGRIDVRSAGVFSTRVTAEEVVVKGGAGNDNLSVGAGIGTLTTVRLEGGLGDDRLNGNEARDTLLGQDGNDLLFGEGGDDSLDGGAGNDQLLGNDGHDVLLAGDGDDVLFGNAGNDNLDGGAGFDFIRGGAGFDVAFDGENVTGVP